MVQYRRLATNERDSMDYEHANTEDENGTKIIFLEIFDAWNMTTLYCLKTDENRGKTDRNNSFKNFTGLFQ